MIAALTGNVLHKEGHSIIVDVHGVGYLVSVTTGLFQAAQEGKEISLVVVTEVRETDISLFGFANRNEREVYLLLKKVKGVGARLAQGIISALGASGLLTAIGRQDITQLRKVPGIGKKTAERLIVELREQVGLLASTERPLSINSTIEVEHNQSEQTAVEPFYDAVLALEKLGFDQIRAKQAVQKVIEHGAKHATDAGSLVRDALAYL